MLLVLSGGCGSQASECTNPDTLTECVDAEINPHPDNDEVTNDAITDAYNCPVEPTPECDAVE